MCLVDDAKGLVQVTSPTLTAGQPILVPASGAGYAARIAATRVLPRIRAVAPN